MTYALIRNSDNAWMGGPFDAEPTAPSGQRVIVVAAGYPSTERWSPEKGGFVDGAFVAGPGGTWLDDPVAVERQLVTAVKEESERRTMLVMTAGGAKKTKYAAKAVEVENWGALGAVGASAATLLAAFNLLPLTARKRKFRFAMAEATFRGEANPAAAIARYRQPDFAADR